MSNPSIKSCGIKNGIWPLKSFEISIKVSLDNALKSNAPLGQTLTHPPHPSQSTWENWSFFSWSIFKIALVGHTSAQFPHVVFKTLPSYWHILIL